MTAPLSSTREKMMDVDALANEIRRLDGDHLNRLGAGALAEALMPFIRRSPSPDVAVEALRPFAKFAEAHDGPQGLSDSVGDERVWLRPSPGYPPITTAHFRRARAAIRAMLSSAPSAAEGKEDDITTEAVAALQAKADKVLGATDDWKIISGDRRASPPDLEGVIHQIKKIADEYKQLINPASATFEILGKIIALSSLPNSPGGVGERERLEDERNVLMNSFGVSPFRDGLTRQRIEEIDRALATAPTAEGEDEGRLVPHHGSGPDDQ